MKAKYIAESGIFIALTLVILYASSIIQISTLSVLTVASCLIPISLIRTNIKYSFLIYLSSSILSFFILPINISLAYLFFFGIYGIIKSYIEKINKQIIEIILKLFCFNILLTMLFFIGKNLITLPSFEYSLYVVIFLAQIFFLIYDYALTIIISVYLNKVNKIS